MTSDVVATTFNVYEKHAERYRDLIENAELFFLEKDKNNPQELKSVVKRCIDELLQGNNWIFGLDYWMLYEYQSGFFLEKAVFALFGITRDFKGQQLTDEQLKLIASMAILAQGSNYSTFANYTSNVKKLIGDVNVHFSGKNILLQIDDINSFALQACFYYNFLPKKIAYNTILIKKVDGPYFWLTDINEPYPEGFTGFPAIGRDDSDTVIIPWYPLEILVFL